MLRPGQRAYLFQVNADLAPNGERKHGQATGMGRVELDTRRGRKGRFSFRTKAEPYDRRMQVQVASEQISQSPTCDDKRVPEVVKAEPLRMGSLLRGENWFKLRGYGTRASSTQSPNMDVAPTEVK